MENANQVKLLIPFKNKYKLQEFMDTIFPRCSLEKSGIDGCFKVRKPEVIDNPIFMPSKINGVSDAKQV